MRRLARWLVGLCGVALIMAAAAFLPRLWPDVGMPQVADTHPDTGDAALIERGRYLARAGNCIGCHTGPGGEPYAGGRRIETPFGDLYTTNLTPDAASGLGTWTAADFWRAMHHGRSRDGRLLYPAFPYPDYTQVSRADSDAIYVFLQSLEPVAADTPPHALRFPYNTQLALRVWRGLFFEPGEFRANQHKSDAWNRGAYLVEGLGHCGACHTARGRLGQTLASADYAGGRIPGLRWTAPALSGASPMSAARAEELKTLLATGVSRRNVTSGPMAEVVFHSLQYLDEADIAAMVEYLRQLPPTSPTLDGPAGLRVPPSQAKRLLKQGRALYVDHCESCHGEDGLGEPRRYPALAGNALVTANATSNVIRSVLEGGFGPSTAGNPRPYGMPPYAHQFSAQQTAAVISYIRQAWGNDASAVSPLDINR